MSNQSITVGVTHEVLIDGERSWIKYEITTRVDEMAGLESTRAYASKMLQEGVMQLIAETVETVRGTDEVQQDG